MELKSLIYKEENKEIYNSLEITTAISFAGKNVGKKIIDKIFDIDKVRYINAYKNSDVYECETIRVLPFDIQIYTERAIGIIEDCINRRDFNNLELLYKTCYKKNYNEYKHLKEMTINNILRISYEVQNNSNLSDVNSKIISTMFVYSYLKQDSITLNSLITGSIKDLLSEFVLFDGFKDRYFNKERINEYKDKITILKNKIGIKTEYSTVEELFAKMLNKDIDEEREKGNYNVALENVMEVGMRAKYIGASDRFFNYLDIDPLELIRTIQLGKKEIEELLLNIVYCFEDNMYDEEDGILIFILYLRLYSLGVEYNNLKKRYMRDVNEEYLLKIEEQKNKYESSLKEIAELKEKLSLREDFIKNKEVELNKENNNLKKENNSLKKELEEYNDLKKEVAKLRELVFKEEIETEDDLESLNTISAEDVMKINLLNVAVVGGSQNWIRKVKEVLNNWTFIGTDSLNNDFSMLKNKDLIIINTKMSHSLYFKVKGILEKNNLNYDYINVSANIDLSLKAIYEKVKENNLM